MTAGVRSKNSEVSLSHKPEFKSTGPPAFTKTRQVRNAIGRLFELQRVASAHGWSAHARNLFAKVDRVFPCGEMSLETWHNSLIALERTWTESKTQDALSAWRSRMLCTIS